MRSLHATSTVPDELSALEVELERWDARQHPRETHGDMSLLDEHDSLEIRAVILEQQLREEDDFGGAPGGLHAHRNDLGVVLILKKFLAMCQDGLHVLQLLWEVDFLRGCCIIWNSVNVLHFGLSVHRKLGDTVLDFVVQKEFGSVWAEAMVCDVVSCPKFIDGNVDFWRKMRQPKTLPEVRRGVTGIQKGGRGIFTDNLETKLAAERMEYVCLPPSASVSGRPAQQRAHAPQSLSRRDYAPALQEIPQRL